MFTNDLLPFQSVCYYTLSTFALWSVLPTADYYEDSAHLASVSGRRACLSADLVGRLA